MVKVVTATMKILLVLALSIVATVWGDQLQDICFLPSDSGFCRAFIPSYYYNSKTRQCESFIYGGCGGNENRFRNQWECKDRCGPNHACTLPVSRGHCRATFPRYYFNTASGECEFFVYGGCGGNSNKFSSKQACEDHCKTGKDICSLPSDSGNCRAYSPYYYYDSISGQCEIFTYGGCGGNENRFLSKQECENRCGQKRKVRMADEQDSCT